MRYLAAVFMFILAGSAMAADGTIIEPRVAKWL
jgi:hypothetical protein